ncbi:MAG: VanW family protein, partial [Proteobacteria bacterium]|nr:VanW family protein [Pseudomonadota bacterium]
AYVNEAQLQAFLAPIAPGLSITPVDARFTFKNDSGQLQVLSGSVDGRELNVAASVAAINESLRTGQHEVALVFDVIVPAVPDTATAAELGITELVSSSTTFFAGSSAVRKLNIEVAARRVHGVVIAPGQEFSFNEYLGDVSEESGFEEGLIIYGGRTVKGVGGGVCQVSTTAFQTAFFAGFPIVERWPHGYRVGYYEGGEGAGMAVPGRSRPTSS